MGNQFPPGIGYKKEEKMFNTSRKTMITSVLFFCAVILGGYVNVQANETIHNNVYVESVNISGMTEKEAEKAIKEYAKGKKAQKIKIDINGKTATSSVGNLGYKWSNTNIPKEAINLGKKGNIIRRYEDKLDIDNNKKVFELEMSIDEKKIKNGLKNLCGPYNVDAKNASLKLTSSGFEVVPEQTGVVVDYDKTTKEVYSYITEKWDKKSDIEVKATTKVEEPKYTSKDLEKISTTPMGSYTTYFTVGGSYENRNKNIQNGAKLLDGGFLYPGEEYSLNDHLAPWTEENGYYPAGTYVNGQVEDSLGGGICQVSSTLYNALLLAEIEIVERSPHSMTVSYVPLSADAALAGDYMDLVFKNNTNAPIYIQAIYTEGSITFNVYGHDERDPNRTIKYESERTGTTKIKTEYKNDNTKPVGYEQVESEGHEGASGKLWKYVYENGKQVDKILVNTSIYSMSPRKVIRGTKKKEQETTTKPAEKTTTKKDKQDETTKSKKEDKTTAKSD